MTQEAAQNADYVRTLDGVTSGTYVVTTYSGTRHVVNLDARTATRYGADGREWGDKMFWGELATLPGQTPKAVGRWEPITPDGTPFHFTSIRDATVGMRMRLDNADEWRVTSEVQSIEGVQNDGSGAEAAS